MFLQGELVRCFRDKSISVNIRILTDGDNMVNFKMISVCRVCLLLICYQPHSVVIKNNKTFSYLLFILRILKNRH